MPDKFTVLIEPGNSVDAIGADSEALAAVLSKVLPEAHFRVVSREQRGRGVTWWEVIRIYLPGEALASALVGAVLAEAIRWCRERFKKVPKRPKYVAIYGPDGKVIKSVLLKDTETEPEDRTAHDQQSTPRLPPPIS